MKNNKIKKYLALFICAAAMLIANTSSSMCWACLFEEPKMPKSLYKFY